MTQYTKCITMIVPEALWDEANHLVGAIGGHIADLQTFDLVPEFTRDGKKYRAFSNLIKPATISKLNKPLSRPAFDTESQIDLVKAESARSKVSYSINDVDTKICILMNSDGSHPRLELGGFERVRSQVV